MVFELKFELMGGSSRKEYREVVLFPGLRRIPGLNIVDWTSIHRTNVRGTTRTVRENYDISNSRGFGGTRGPTSMPGDRSSAMTTPRASLDHIIDDWAEAGVQLYDVPMNTRDMRYSVMIPVEALVPLMSSQYRGDMNDFRGRYENFIKNGADAPIFLAIGQNGRAKITGNEDLVWFAKKAGLEELPVFISYQKQA